MERYLLSGILIADGCSLATGADPAPGGESAGPDPTHLERAFAALQPWVDDIVWVASDPAALLARDGLIVSDHFDAPGLLGAIHAGLFATRHEQALVIAAALPLPSEPVLDLLARAAAPRWDGVLLDAASGEQPLPAIYHKRCLKLLARQLAEGRGQATRFLRQLHRHLIPEDAARQADGLWVPLFHEPKRERRHPDEM